MRIQLAVLGAGSLIGRHLCRRAVRIGWDVHAYSMYDIATVYKQSSTLRQRTFGHRGVGENEAQWLSDIAWMTDLNYDENFERLQDDIRNVTGLVYFYEETPLLKSEQTTFEENVIKLSKLAGTWSVRHFVTVQSEEYSPHSILSNKAQQQIGQSNPFMIVSLLRPGKVYSYSHFSSCIPVYKNRTLRSIGIDTKPVDIINAETVAKCITTLIHNTNDPNIYRILESHEIEQYLAEEHVPFDSPDYDYYVPEEEEEAEQEEEMDADQETTQDNESEQKSKSRSGHKIISLGFQDNNSTTAHHQLDNETETAAESDSVRDEEEKPDGKIL
mmetsp:Transcript_10219/g.16460  ORF Transcript_10219/g.16460 Transcript_10219/m.16460 type:complete len:329 (-) Transcript_10219:1158-2144(-)